MVNLNEYDSVIAGTDKDALYRERRARVYGYLAEHGLAAVLFEDSEDRRDPAVRYLTGHPSDALLVLTAERQAVLVPWDEHLAAQKAHADSVLPSTRFDRDNVKAAASVLAALEGSGSPAVALPPETAFVRHQKYCAALPGFTVRCEEDSVHDFVQGLRAQKDAYEIACTRKACAITSGMTDRIIARLERGEHLTEADVALFAERELRAQGCERASFDTLAAGPGRSFAIHAFPGYTAAPWGTQGLSILDYGVCYEGYASDCTITVARGPLSAAQEELLALVQRAADECLALYKPGRAVREASLHADAVFASAGRKMPHGLGHGTGIEIHERPFVSMRTAEGTCFCPGNIVTLEPGLYDPELGGCRLENDVLITDCGNEVLTNSRIVRL